MKVVIQKVEGMPIIQIKECGEKEPVKIMQELEPLLGSQWRRHRMVVQLIVVHLKLS